MGHPVRTQNQNPHPFGFAQGRLCRKKRDKGGAPDEILRGLAIGFPVAFLFGAERSTTEDTEDTEDFMLALLMWSGVAPATTYYVSSSAGSDANNGTSVASAWKTLAKVNGQTFQAGDSILLKRGDVWNESLVPPSSGASANPITFDAYGTGAAPNMTGYYAVPSSSWIQVTGNDWKASVPSSYTTINFCLFG